MSNVDVDTVSRQSKVGYLQHFVGGDEYVARGQITVNDAAFLQMRHAAGNLQGETLQILVVQTVFDGRFDGGRRENVAVIVRPQIIS